MFHNWSSVLQTAILSHVLRSVVYAQLNPHNNAQFQEQNHWVGIWGAMPQLTEPSNLPPRPYMEADRVFFNTTIRQTVHVSVAAKRIRLSLSNEFGRSPLSITKMTVANAEQPGSPHFQQGQLRDVSFSNQTSTVILPGQVGTTDPISIDVSPLIDISISIYLAVGQKGTQITSHPGSRTTSWFQHGDNTHLPDISTRPGANKATHWYFLSAMEAWLPQQTSAFVIMGDSITDGRGSTDNGNDRWPDQLSARLWRATTRNSSKTAAPRVSIVNMAAGANKVLPGSGGAGTPAAERVRRDVLARAGVRWAMIFEGVNDIGGAPAAAAPQKAVGDALIAAYEKMVLQMRAGGIKVFGGTITPFGTRGTGVANSYSHPEREKTRQRVNDWIRKSGKFDAVVEFDAAVRDPEKKDTLVRSYDTGDHLHLNAVGYKAMADFFNLDLFR